MNRYHGPIGGAGSSKATASTLCQKCLKRGHYSFECKASTQQRPYAARPSRTQQLLNPKLLPKLMSEVPNDLLRKKGVADEQLAKKERERALQREETHEEVLMDRNRSASVSTQSTISTISTNLSRSQSPGKDEDMNYYHSQRSPSPMPPFRETESKKKRRRSPSSSVSNRSETSVEKEGLSRSKHFDRHTRRRQNSRSPGERGRRRSRSSHRYDDEKPRRDRSRTVDQSRIARERQRSFTPSENKPSHRTRGGSRSERRMRERSMSDEADAGTSRRRSRHNDDRYEDDYQGSRRHEPPNNNKRPARDERSLSPYSKRLALTQAMNMAR
ncbi:MAG: hypothetical protein M1829_004362 [Trizodia sp. TS-e1964]|nr:MAG: hypothetical protein M1829_004362 [Trizodia sp. TS-e1964]